MDSIVLGGFIAVGLIVIVNILAVSYFIGKLKQKVDDLCLMVERLQGIQNSKDRDARRSLDT